MIVIKNGMSDNTIMNYPITPYLFLSLVLQSLVIGVFNVVLKLVYE